ncbi:MAG: PhzF family phenazine biosynthesis protein [Promicromonosporaceae bacterium]|nr:PhzF family phenazine biosynthesis protein [Promicromonosporaceae bacterium]
MRYTEVDVFTNRALLGNPVAVVHDADGLSDETMAAFARWTNLSETTFLLPPTPAGAAAGADYRLRIFTPGGELPFAGHPTLGSARAWLDAQTIVEPLPKQLIQECGAGLIDVRVESNGSRLAFAAPPLLRSGPVDDATYAQLAAALRISPTDIQAAQWIDNGPGWVGVLLASADAVLTVRPDFAAMGSLRVGIAGPHAGASRPADVEARAFGPSLGVPEDPVTGSLGAGLGGWLPGIGVVGETFTIRQGTVLQRRGLLHISRDESGQVWVAGDTLPLIIGEVTL